MSLSKQQMLGAVGAGVFVVCAGGLGFMLYSAWSERGEAEEARQSQTEAFRNFNNAAVYPSKVSIESVKSNEIVYTEWQESAMKLAARGDKVLASETPPIFKQRLQAEVRRMLALPGDVDGKIAQAAFMFGFEQLLGENAQLPPEREIPHLAVQLDTITQVVDLLAESNILEIKAIQRLDEKSEVKEGEEDAQPQKKPAKKAQEGAEGAQETCLRYAFEFTTRPAALVSVLNSLTACERFMTIKNLTFRETADVIVDRLNAIENAKNGKNVAKTAVGGRRGRRGAAATPGKPEEEVVEKVDPLIVDPEMDAPLQVNFVLEVRDFGRATEPEAPAAESAEKPAEENADANKSEEKKPEDAAAASKQPEEKKPEAAKAAEKKEDKE